MLEPPLPVLLDHDEAALGYVSEMANKGRTPAITTRAWWLASWMKTAHLFSLYRFLLRTPEILNKMTMDDVWSLARPKRPDWNRRIWVIIATFSPVPDNWAKIGAWTSALLRRSSSSSLDRAREVFAAAIYHPASPWRSREFSSRHGRKPVGPENLL